jgi:hypothetical protein
MIAFAYYLLKVIACPGILYGYYLLPLQILHFVSTSDKSRRFHFSGIFFGMNKYGFL